MTSKRIFLTVLFAIVTISFLFNVSAATGAIFYTPNANESNISGAAYTLYGNITEAAADSSIGNVTFWYQPRSYALNATWTLIARVQNTTNQSRFNTTWDTTAVTDGNYWLNFTSVTYPTNDTVNATNATLSLTIDNTAPTMVVYGTAPTAYANTSIRTSTAVATANLTLSIYITDATKGMANTSLSVCFVNVGGGVNHTIPMFSTGRTTGWCNASDTNASTAINISGLTDGNKTINIYVNDTITNSLNTTLVAHIDTTAPTSTATCSPTTAQTGATFPCSCSGTDATSGVSTSTGTSTSPNGNSTPSSTGGFTYTCTVTDNGGLTASATKAYSIIQSPGSGGSGGSGGSSETPKPQVFSFTKITPGAATIVKNFDANTGVKEIQITVNNEAQNVQVTVTKYDGKPAEVSVSKSGKVYQYMQINVSNVEDKLSKAKITAKVTKLWATSNGVDKNNVVISKFDETNGKWNELPTTYSSEDTTYYYYDAEVTSFSYFAVSEKAVAGEESEQETTGTTETETTTGKNLTWLWIVIGVIVIALIWWVTAKKKK